jgi:hypothetical protein
MDWEKEIEEVKAMTVWILLGAFLTVNAEYARTKQYGNEIIDLLLVNMALLGSVLIGWGLLSFLLNTVRLTLVTEKKESEE